MIDPYLPHTGNFDTGCRDTSWNSEYKVNINRLAGVATITAVTLASLQTLTLICPTRSPSTK